MGTKRNTPAGPDFLAELDAMEADMKVAGAGAVNTTQVFPGVDQAEAAALARTLIAQHGYTVNKEAVRKQGISARTNERIMLFQVKSPTKPSNVLSYYPGTLKLVMAGNLPDGVELPASARK